MPSSPAAATRVAQRPVRARDSRRAVPPGRGARRARPQDAKSIRNCSRCKPVGDYGHRVVLDLVPADAARPADGAARRRPRRAPRAPRARRRSADNAGRRQRAARAARACRREAAHHHRHRPGPWRRGSRRDRPPRHLREARRAGHRAQAQGAARRASPACARCSPATTTISCRSRSACRRRARCRRTCSSRSMPTHSPRPTAHGSSVFALSEHGATSAAAALAGAAREPVRPDRRGQSRTPAIRSSSAPLLDMSQTAQISDSLRVGRSVLDGIGAVNALHKGSVEQAGFAVLKAPDIPSILVETAFISNPDEELKLQQRRAAEPVRRPRSAPASSATSRRIRRSPARSWVSRDALAAAIAYNGARCGAGRQACAAVRRRRPAGA